MGFHHDAQAGLELLTSGDPPTSASQSVGITGVHPASGFLIVATVLDVLLICIYLMISDLPIFSCAYWQFVYLLWKNVYSSHFPVFKSDCVGYFVDF